MNSCVHNMPFSGCNSILTKTGWLELSSLEDETVKIWTQDKWADAMITKTYDEPYYISVRTKDGSCIECSPNTTFILKNGNTVLAQDLSLHMEIASPRNLPVFDIQHSNSKQAYTTGVFHALITDTYQFALTPDKYNLCQYVETIDCKIDGNKMICTIDKDTRFAGISNPSYLLAGILDAGCIMKLIKYKNEMQLYGMDIDMHGYIYGKRNNLPTHFEPKLYGRLKDIDRQVHNLAIEYEDEDEKNDMYTVDGNFSTCMIGGMLVSTK